MNITDICKDYFNGFQEVSNLKRNTPTKNALAVLKILSYFTVIIPLGFAVVYGASTLHERVTKKQNLSPHEQTIQDTAKSTLLKSDSFFEEATSRTRISTNQQLADKIIAARGDDEYITAICSGDFLVDPTASLVYAMIERGVGMVRMDDPARAFIIGQIPDFIETISSPAYLRSIAEKYFKDDSNKKEILQVFDKSLSSPEFQRALKSAIQEFKHSQDESSLIRAENALRVPLTIFYQSAQLKKYSYPKGANLE